MAVHTHKLFKINLITHFTAQRAPKDLDAPFHIAFGPLGSIHAVYTHCNVVLE